jgi:hypothetical protein
MPLTFWGCSCTFIRLSESKYSLFQYSLFYEKTVEGITHRTIILSTKTCKPSIKISHNFQYNSTWLIGQILLCITAAGMPLSNGHLIFHQCFCGYLSPLHTGLFSSLVITSHIVTIQHYIVNLFPDGQFTQGQ